MKRPSEWRRVSRRRPCPVCERPDWCLYLGSDDTPAAAICARIESPQRAGEAGWLHRLRDDWRQPMPRRTIRLTVQTESERPIVDLAAYARQCRLACTPEALRRLGDSLGLSLVSLARLSVGWSRRHEAWTFPMRDAAGGVVGIRLRLTDGRKLSVRGGHEGLFLPADLDGHELLLICEGPTDTAALLDWGLPAVGRPSCSGGAKLLCELVATARPANVVIVADGDAPGRRGAEHLAGTLAAYAPAVRIIVPPDGIKDARAWRQSGGVTEDIRQAIDAAAIRPLSVHVQPRKVGEHGGRRRPRA